MNRGDRGQRWKAAIKRAKEVRHKLQAWRRQGSLSDKGLDYLTMLEKVISRYEDGERTPELLAELECTKELVLGG
jgi:predicted transcriptional regulator